MPQDGRALVKELTTMPAAMREVGGQGLHRP
jgi:hypothetical protein